MPLALAVLLTSQERDGEGHGTEQRDGEERADDEVGDDPRAARRRDREHPAPLGPAVCELGFEEGVVGRGQASLPDPGVRQQRGGAEPTAIEDLAHAQRVRAPALRAVHGGARGPSALAGYGPSGTDEVAAKTAAKMPKEAAGTTLDIVWLEAPAACSAPMSPPMRSTTVPTTSRGKRGWFFFFASGPPNVRFQLLARALSPLCVQASPDLRAVSGEGLDVRGRELDGRLAVGAVDRPLEDEQRHAAAAARARDGVDTLAHGSAA